MIDEFFSMTSKPGYWNNKELCKEEAKKYESRTKFKRKYWAAYNYSVKNNWIDEFYPKK